MAIVPEPLVQLLLYVSGPQTATKKTHLTRASALRRLASLRSGLVVVRARARRFALSACAAHPPSCRAAAPAAFAQACFGVYLFMGLVMMIMGGLYWSDAGAVGATAVYLLLIGFLMLVVGGIALFANFKKIWLILLIIELFNVALFLFLYVVIVIVLMMASGSSDPVTKSTKASWDTLLPELVFTGSDGNGGIYCQTATGGTACDRFWSPTIGPANPDDGDCDIAVADLGDILSNCSAIQTNPQCR